MPLLAVSPQPLSVSQSLHKDASWRSPYVHALPSNAMKGVSDVDGRKWRGTMRWEGSPPVCCWCFSSSPWKWDSSKMGNPLPTSVPPCPLPPPPPSIYTHHASTLLWNNILVRQQACGLQGGMLSSRTGASHLSGLQCVREIFIPFPTPTPPTLTASSTVTG